MKKDDNIKEQFKQALISTIKVISDEYKNDPKANPNLSSKNFNFFELDNLNSRNDFIRLRAETDKVTPTNRIKSRLLFKLSRLYSIKSRNRFGSS